jgi:hypothetical protein
MDEQIAALRTRGVRFLHERPAEGERGRYAAFADSFGTVREIREATGGRDS